MNYNNCGCNTHYLFPQTRLDSGYQGPPGPYPCRPHLPCLAKNFVPVLGSPMVVEVTNTASLFVGQGIKIGSGHYTITDILDALRLQLQTDGVGVIPNIPLIAIEPVYGCYQYPIIPEGKGSLTFTPQLVGLDLPGSASMNGSLVSSARNIMVYGNTGPNTIDLKADVILQTASNPFWVGIQLPRPARVVPEPIFTCYIEDGGAIKPGVAKLGTGSYGSFIITGPGSGNAWSNGTSRRAVISGSYEVI